MRDLDPRIALDIAWEYDNPSKLVRFIDYAEPIDARVRTWISWFVSETRFVRLDSEIDRAEVRRAVLPYQGLDPIASDDRKALVALLSVCRISRRHRGPRKIPPWKSNRAPLKF